MPRKQDFTTGVVRPQSENPDVSLVERSQVPPKQDFTTGVVRPQPAEQAHVNEPRAAKRGRGKAPRPT
jgi:hypothetical protein